MALFAASCISLLLPCFWQSRIQAGDLSSHIYNAWLSQLIAAGQAPGLAIVSQTTNTLFDLLLSWSFRWVGPSAAQRLVVAAAVLLFAWGAFAFVAAVSSRAPRAWMPVFAVLAYGWVFHSGFFNFYLSLGLCFFAGALAWEAKPRRCVLAGAILAVAWTAHNLPVLWMVSIVAYAWIARRLPPRRCAFLFAGCVAALAAVHAVVRLSVFSIWYPSQIRLATGADQAWLFDDKYLIPVFGLALLLWIVFIDWAIAAGIRRMAAAIPAQVWALTAAGVRWSRQPSPSRAGSRRSSPTACRSPRESAGSPCSARSGCAPGNGMASSPWRWSSSRFSFGTAASSTRSKTGCRPRSHSCRQASAW